MVVAHAHVFFFLGSYSGHVTGCYNKLVDIASRDLLSAPLQATSS